MFSTTTHVSGTGQKANTHAHTLLLQLTTKTKLLAECYRAPCKAPSTFDSAGDWLQRLLPFCSEDICGPGGGEDEESEG